MPMFIFNADERGRFYFPCRNCTCHTGFQTALTLDCHVRTHNTQLQFQSNLYCVYDLHAQPALMGEGRDFVYCLYTFKLYFDLKSILIIVILSGSGVIRLSTRSTAFLTYRFFASPLFCLIGASVLFYLLAQEKRKCKREAKLKIDLNCSFGVRQWLLITIIDVIWNRQNGI